VSIDAWVSLQHLQHLLLLLLLLLLQMMHAQSSRALAQPEAGADTGLDLPRS
jgi:hypothetical protein